MARPSRCRRICLEPEYDRFAPCGVSDGEQIVLTVDEYEAVRLIDFEKKTHEQCARQMGISRTTVTEMYETARFKIADCLVNGKQLRAGTTGCATGPRGLAAAGTAERPASHPTARLIMQKERVT